MSANASASPSHLSIGDVLGNLREEFPDITISKIRFLESQGLIDPERTPSGYRKFYDADVARLRWILYQQKEHFLPLRVIKERLEHLDLGGEPVPDSDPDAEPAREIPTRGRGADEPAVDGSPEGAEALSLAGGADVDHEEGDEVAPDPEVTSEPATRAVASSGVSLTRAELARAADLEVRQVADLESFGLLTPAARSEDEVLFDEEALAIARAAAGFARHGIEPRHLRMYKHFAQREADLFEQLLLPYVRQRNPDARAKVNTDLADLAKLGRALRSALLVSAVREALSD